MKQIHFFILLLFFLFVTMVTIFVITDKKRKKTWKEELDKWIDDNSYIPFENLPHNKVSIICSPIIHFNLKNSEFSYYISNKVLPNEHFNNGQNEFSKDNLIYLQKNNHFLNKTDKTSILIIPPYENDDNGNKKNFSSIYHFQKNASKEIKKKYWKYVAQTIINICNGHIYPNQFKNNSSIDKIYINTHGLGVPYLHIRVDPNKLKYH